jgi:hypothetical protein
MIVIDCSPNLRVSTYLEIMDENHRNMLDFNTIKRELPLGSV